MAIDQKDQLHGAEALDKLRALLAEFSIACMVTVLDAVAHVRPIGIVDGTADFDGALWFITDSRSRKVAEITAGAATTLVFQNDARGRYAHLRGQATVVTDRQRLADLYTPDQRIWFPDGLDDPNMTLLRFDVTDADYWDGHASTVRRLAAFVKSVVTGQPAQSGDTGVADIRA